MRVLHVVGLLLVATPAAASTYDPPDCKRRSAARAEALAMRQTIYERLHPPQGQLRIETSAPKPKPPAPPPSLRSLVQRLLAHRCMHVARRLMIEPLPQRDAPIRAWLDRGGYEWINSALKRNERIVMLRVPPSFRPWYDATIGEAHPLAPFVCAADTSTCGADARGWLHRARHAEHVALSKIRWGPVCQGETTAQSWAECLLRRRMFAEREVLPDGRFRSPTEGELIWTRSGGGTQAWWFDVATARAVRVVFDHGGTVEEGRISQDNLREALLRVALEAHKVKVAAAVSLSAYYRRREHRELDLGKVLDKLDEEQAGVGGLGMSGGPTEGWSFAAATGAPFRLQRGVTRDQGGWGVRITDNLELEVTRRGFVASTRRVLSRAEADHVAGQIDGGVEAHAQIRAWLKRRRPAAAGAGP